MSEQQRQFWTEINGRSTVLSARPDLPSGVVDLEGVYGRLMDHIGCDVILERPDFFIFGTCKTVDAVPELIDELGRGLGAAATQPSQTSS